MWRDVALSVLLLDPEATRLYLVASLITRAAARFGAHHPHVLGGTFSDIDWP